jgi:putative phosphoribosyl transferase
MFKDRRSAGRRLARRHRHLAESNPTALALPRGGVPVAFEVARTPTALREEVDELVRLSSPEPIVAIGCHYTDFRQFEDAEAVAFIKEGRRRAAASVPAAPR